LAVARGASGPVTRSATGAGGSDGWKAALPGEPTTDLVPEALVVAGSLVDEQAKVEALEAERDAITRELEELPSPAGDLSDPADPTGLRGPPDEPALLRPHLALLDQEADAARRAKAAQRALAARAAAKCGTLTEDEVRALGGIQGGSEAKKW